ALRTRERGPRAVGPRLRRRRRDPAAARPLQVAVEVGRLEREADPALAALLERVERERHAGGVEAGPVRAGVGGGEAEPVLVELTHPLDVGRERDGLDQSVHGHSVAIQTLFTWVYSARQSGPRSRPNPDCLTPPNGMPAS